MDKRRHTRFGTIFFLAYCSLTLTILGCSGGSGDPNAVPAPKVGVTADEMYGIIKESPRPYVLLNFYATWCKPCRKEMPELVALQQDPNSTVEVILVSLDEADVVKDDLRGFLSNFGVNFQTYAVPDNYGAFVARFYGIWNGSIPLSLIYTKQGKMVEALTGLTDRAEIELIVNMDSKLGS